MIDKESLERIVAELFPDIEISQFSTDWILYCPSATEISVRQIYGFLIAYGLKDDKIASHADLLGRDPETIERNYQRLSALGLKPDKIASQAQLLGFNPETIERNYQRLLNLGLNDHQIAKHAELLGHNPETIERNYQSHIRLLRQNYQDRTSGRDLLMTQAQLLGIPPESINANVQFLHRRRIDYHNAFLLGTSTQTKRKKMAWMLRELFDYRILPQERRRDAINNLYGFIKDYSRCLVSSIKTLEENKDKLRKIVADYQ